MGAGISAFTIARRAARAITCPQHTLARQGLRCAPLAEDVAEQSRKNGRQRVTPIVGVAREMHAGVWVRSVYFRDPNGIMLEYAATLRDFRPEDVAHEPGRAKAPASEPAVA